MIRAIIAGFILLFPIFSFALTAKAFIVTDMDGTVIMSSAPDEERAIASITKLVTVERSKYLDQNELITITKEDVKEGHMRKTPLRAGKAYTRAQLIELALIPSDNVAAIALGRTASIAEIGYLLPEHTIIVEASGLDPNNKSTARDLAEYARSLYNTPTAAVSVQEVTEVGKRGSTNPLLNKQGWVFYLSKTGFIRDSGGCLVVITMVGDKLMTIAILGSKDTHQRWNDLIEIRTMLGDAGFYEPKLPSKRVYLARSTHSPQVVKQKTHRKRRK